MTARPILVLTMGSVSGYAPDLAKRRGEYVDFAAVGLGEGSVTNLLAYVDGENELPSIDETINKYSGVLITGSTSMVTDEAPWSERAAAYLTKLVALRPKTFPILGICYGHQLLTKALGGVVDYNPNGINLGTVSCAFDPTALAEDPLLSCLRGVEPLEVQTSHSQAVVSPPLGSRVLATCAKDTNHMIRFTDNVYGVQFHPEFDEEVARVHVELRRGKMDISGFVVRESPVGVKVLGRFRALCDEHSRGYAGTG